MPQPDRGPRILPPTVYYYRREMTVRELMTAAGVAVGAGLAAFYLARLMLQRTPLLREPEVARLDDRGAVVRRREPSRQSGRGAPAGR